MAGLVIAALAVAIIAVAAFVGYAACVVAGHTDDDMEGIDHDSIPPDRRQ